MLLRTVQQPSLREASRVDSRLDNKARTLAIEPWYRSQEVWKQKLIPAVLLALLVAWPLRRGFLWNYVDGAGPDVLSTLWGMWWFQQVGLGGMVGGTRIPKSPES